MPCATVRLESPRTNNAWTHTPRVSESCSLSSRVAPAKGSSSPWGCARTCSFSLGKGRNCTRGRSGGFVLVESRKGAGEPEGGLLFRACASVTFFILRLLLCAVFYFLRMLFNRVLVSVFAIGTGWIVEAKTGFGCPSTFESASIRLIVSCL